MFIRVTLFISILVSVTFADTLLVVTEEWEPFNYTQNGEIVGLSTQVVKATLERAEIPHKIKMYPWARAFEMARYKKNILIYSIYRNEEREYAFHWIGPINPPSDYYLYRLKERSDIHLDSLTDAKRYKIGVMRDDASHQIFLDAGFTDAKHLDVITSEMLNIKKLLAGRVDLIPAAELSLSARMKRLNVPYSTVEKAHLFIKGDARSYMAFGKNSSPDLVQKVKAAFEELKSEGVIDSIITNYLP